MIRWFVAGGLVMGGVAGYMAADVHVVNEVVKNVLHTPDLIKSVAHMLSTTDVHTALAAIDGGARAIMTAVGAGALGKITHFSLTELARGAQNEDVRNARRQTSAGSQIRRRNDQKAARERTEYYKKK